MSKTKYKRFVKTYSQGALDGFEIWVDKETGVNYVYRQCGYSGGLSPLLDAFGKPIITPLPIETCDERCTTVSAYNYMIATNTKKTKKRDIVDTISAEIILQTFIGMFSSGAALLTPKET